MDPSGEKLTNGLAEPSDWTGPIGTNFAPPPTGTIATWPLPPELISTTSRAPSGENAGRPTWMSTEPSNVSTRSTPESTARTWIPLSDASLDLVKVIRLPSCDRIGSPTTYWGGGGGATPPLPRPP